MTTEEIKETIKEFALGLGVDAVGFASTGDYRSERSPAIKDLLPNAQSMVVLGYREPDGALNSPIARISMAARLAVMDLAKRNNLIIAKFIENQFAAEAAFVLVSYPMDSQKGLVADVSLRHAAVAAGLGVFGRHNLVIVQLGDMGNLKIPVDFRRNPPQLVRLRALIDEVTQIHG